MGKDKIPLNLTEAVDLDERLDREFHRFRIPEQDQSSAREFLDLLSTIPSQKEHSIRVALRGASILGKDIKGYDFGEFLVSFLLHDIGKSEDPEIYQGDRSFGAPEMTKRKNHPVLSHRLLKERFPFAAEVALRHHLEQKDYYPTGELVYPNIFSYADCERVREHSRLLSVVDCYDAMTTRTNGRNGGRLSSPEETQCFLLKDKPGCAILISHLYDIGVLGNGLVSTDAE